VTLACARERTGIAPSIAGSNFDCFISLDCGGVQQRKPELFTISILSIVPAAVDIQHENDGSLLMPSRCFRRINMCRGLLHKVRLRDGNIFLHRIRLRATERPQTASRAAVEAPAWVRELSHPVLVVAVAAVFPPAWEEPPAEPLAAAAQRLVLVLAEAVAAL
jgi:hypothetical protein